MGRRRDEHGTALVLRITDAGCRAIGIEPEQRLGPDGLPADGYATGEGPTNQVPGDKEQAEAPQDAAPASAENRVPRNLRDAARRALDAWDEEANKRCDLVDAMGAPRTALAANPARRPVHHRPPRQGTKLMAVLRKPEGKTVAQVCESTGWTKDTVRGFFVGLKKKGIQVEAVEKLRSVGPNRAGGRGSYTIYRVTEAGDA